MFTKTHGKIRSVLIRDYDFADCIIDTCGKSIDTQVIEKAAKALSACDEPAIIQFAEPPKTATTCASPQQNSGDKCGLANLL